MRFGAEETGVIGPSGKPVACVCESIAACPGGKAPRLRILVVEDDPDMLAATLELLQLLGHWASGVQSAEGALTRFFDGAFDALLTDVGLPGLSGRELVEKLRGRYELPVVFATGHPVPEQLPPGTVWLQKPYTAEQLDEALRWVVRLPPPDREHAT